MITCIRLGFFGLMLSTAVSAQEINPAAPGYGILPFSLPAPDSYALPVIMPAADGDVLHSDGQVRRLHGLMGDKLVVLSFIYAGCSDNNGCPLATQVLHKIGRQLQKQPKLADNLRLLTISFDPVHDTPDTMRRFAAGFHDSGYDWQFLTTRDDADLKPILDAYQQDIEKIYDDRQQFVGSYSHLLRVYLIDRNRQIRNIYNVDTLHADVVINDIRNLLYGSKPSAAPNTASRERFYRPGDSKQNYRQNDYRTQSLALEQRQGKPDDLLAYALRPPLGLPELSKSGAATLTPVKIALGRKLFFDRRMSLNNTLSCAMCHIPEQGFASNEMAKAVGVEGRQVRRNSPSLYNVAYAQLLFHDGRENSLEQQAWGPLLARNEMANPSIGYVVDKIKAQADYRGLFEQAFNRGPTMDTIGQALASYQRTLNSANSPFDRWFYAKQEQAIGEDAKRGFELFSGKAGCIGCHTIDKRTALFSDQQRHNTGVGYLDSSKRPPDRQQLQVAPGIFLTVDSKSLKGLNTDKPGDLGYYEISQNPADRWTYKTPSLRNVALSSPYMHNGSLPSLEDVVRFYNRGGVVNEGLSPKIRPLSLTEAEISELIAFLRTLTGDNVENLVADAFAAPIGEMQ